MIGSRRSALYYLLVLIGLMLAPVAIQSSRAQTRGQSPVSATVEPAQVTVGDTVMYEVTVQVTGAGQPQVAVPVMDPDSGLSTPVPSGTQTSVQTYINNGQFVSIQSIIYRYSIRTGKVGDFTIPPATVTLNGRTYDTQPVQVKVRPLPEAKNIPTELEGLVVPPQLHDNPELQRRLTGVVFILPVISDTEPYNGEQVRVSYHLVIDPKALSDAGLLPRTNLDNIRIPQMSDFIAEELYPFPQDLKFQEREIGNQLYLVAPIYEAVIASTKSGDLSIEPFQISMLFTLKNQSGRRQSPFDDPFFSSLGGLSPLGGNAVNVIAQSPVLKLNVKPVPTENRPADFAGAVGTFNMRAEVDKKQARTYDDTIKLDVIVEGEGNTESLSPPTLPDLPAFSVLGEPEVESSGRKEDDRYISSKRFSYTLRPTTPGNNSIPPITMSTFNPESEEFVKIASEPIPMTISAGSRPAPAPVKASAEPVDEASPAPEADLRYIATGTLPSAGFISGLTVPRVAALFLLPLAITIAGVALSWQQKHSAHKRVDRRRLDTASSSHHLKEAHRSLGAGEIAKVYGELSEGIRLFFAARFGISVAEVTVPEIEERLSRKGAPRDLINKVTHVLEACDAARYAPVVPSRGEAVTSVNDAEKVLKEAGKYV